MSASVLIVEDERIVAKDLQQSLRALGYDAFAIAASADEALARAAERCPDVVLLDIRIRGRRDGIDLARSFRDRAAVVFLTAHADEGTLDRARRTGPYGYLLKPVKTVDLRITIEIALHKRQLDQELRDQDSWRKQTILAIADGVFSVDADGRVALMNAAAERLTGVGRADAIGFPLANTLRLVGGDGEGNEPLPTAFAALESAARRERLHVRSKDGGLREVRLSVAPVREGERDLGSVLVLHDITEERRTQRRVELADRLISLTTMVLGVASEVNNPLAIVAANTAFAIEDLTTLRTDLDDEHRPRLDDVLGLLAQARVAAGRIERVIDDLRTVGRTAAVAPVSSRCHANVAEGARRAVAALRLPEGVRIGIDLGEHLVVGIHPARLEQLLGALLTNAEKALSTVTDRDRAITIAGHETIEEVILDVGDTGCGIAPELQHRVFEPFFTTRGVGQGVGLGLSICDGIVSAAGGRIELASAIDRGTRVRLVLPRPANLPPDAG